MKMKNELPKKGDIVMIDDEFCYGNYSQFIKYHWKYAIRWAYKCMPNKSHLFRVLGVHSHVQDDRFDRQQFVIAVEDIRTRQIFLTGELGIKLFREGDK